MKLAFVSEYKSIKNFESIFWTIISTQTASAYRHQFKSIMILNLEKNG